ncbi:GSCOCG00012509001-RA-CDS, partial [Cotesia congregata]
MFKRDETPIHVAISKENTEAVGLLIQHGGIIVEKLYQRIHKISEQSSNENETFVNDSRKRRYSMTFWKYDPDCENIMRYYRQQILSFYMEDTVEESTITLMKTSTFMFSMAECWELRSISQCLNRCHSSIVSKNLTAL